MEINFEGLISVTALFISLGLFVRQEFFAKIKWRKSNTFELFNLWNSDTLRNARTELWDYFEAGGEVSISRIRSKRDLSKSLNVVGHFFIECAELSKSGYIDDKTFYTVIKEPLEGWKEFFKNFSDEDFRDGTMKIETIRTSIDYLSSKKS